MWAWFDSVCNFLNANSGALMVIITVVYVVATIAIWRANSTSAKATKEQTEESKRQFEETKRLEHLPVMKVRFTSKEPKDFLDAFYTDMVFNFGSIGVQSVGINGKCVELSNVGVGLAVDISCRFTVAERCIKDRFSQTVLSPNQMCESTIDISADASEEPRPVKGTLVVCFKDVLDNHYGQPVEVALLIHNLGIEIENYRVHEPILIDLVENK